MIWYYRAIKKYLVFSGRATLHEFWSFAFFNIIFLLLFYLIDNLITDYDSINMLILTKAYFAFQILPALAISARRLHDTNKSEDWLWILLLPFVGFILLLVLLAKKGNPQINEYDREHWLKQAQIANERKMDETLSYYFQCPYCSAILEKSPLDFAYGQAKGVFLSTHQTSEICPKCKKRIDRMSIINGSYDV